MIVVEGRWGGAKKWGKKADPFEGMHSARQNNFRAALHNYGDSDGPKPLHTDFPPPEKLQGLW